MALRTRQSRQGRIKVLKHTKTTAKRTGKYDQMATEKGAIIQVIMQAVIEATKVVVHVIMAERGDRAVCMRPKINIPSLTFNFTKE